MKTSKLDNVCPYCNFKIEAVTNIESDESPTQGDLNICIKCLGISQYDNVINLIKMTDKEVEGLDEDTKNILKQTQKAIYGL